MMSKTDMTEAIAPAATGDDEAAQLAALDRIVQEASAADAVEDYAPGSAPEKEPEPDNSGAEMWGGAFLMIFGLVASRAGDHWALTMGEAEELGRAADAVAEKYLPGMRMGPEGALVACAVVVFMPRLMEHKRIQAAAVEAARQRAISQAGEGGSSGDQ